MAVESAKATDRRSVQYQDLQDLLQDVEQLARGEPRTLGNKTFPQILKHLSIVMNGSMDGMAMRVPWYFKMIGKLLKNRILSSPMRPGFRLPAEAEKTLWPEVSSLPEALDAFRKSIKRLETEPKREPSPFLGPLTREEWDKLHLRHAELHMSYVVPAGG